MGVKVRSRLRLSLDQVTADAALLRELEMARFESERSVWKRPNHRAHRERAENHESLVKSLDALIEAARAARLMIC